MPVPLLACIGRQTLATQLQEQLDSERIEKAGLQAQVAVAESRSCTLESQLQEARAALLTAQERGQQQAATTEQDRQQGRQQLQQAKADAYTQVGAIFLTDVGAWPLYRCLLFSCSCRKGLQMGLVDVEPRT
jgi:hypothetical protein